jgi:hypothetical protein
VSTLLELAELCQKATGPDRELDAHIHYQIMGLDQVYDVATFLASDIAGSHPKHYTSSFDAAISLVPAAHDWIVASVNGQVGGTPYACVGSAKEHFAETPVLSLVLAALRARASSDPRPAAELSPPGDK